MHGYPVMQVVQYHVQQAPSPAPFQPPPPFQRYHHQPPITHHTPCTTHHGGAGSTRHHHQGIKKYVFWCCACGGLSTIIGALFLAVYFMLRSYTSTLGYFETIPTFVPATMLMLTGLCVMSLARRRNRFSYLIKVSGLCCLVCALTCVLVTITTTVIHMNRLQTLRECVYTQKTRTCTCYSVLTDPRAEPNEGTRFVFDSTPDCEVIHGALYSCLRAMFGLSVSGILVCIFSCMLVYQLLSHERKKMYWEQLELRCRSLYQHQSATAATTTTGSVRGPPGQPLPSLSGSGFCSCCEECRYTPIPANPHMYPWDVHALDRFWTPGRIGNFYSPNPGEEITQTSTINPDPGGTRNTTSGWNWRRFPWTSRTSVVNSPDSQYGFNTIPPNAIENTTSSAYTVLADRSAPPAATGYVWGPPPPYSNPDSPARRGPLASPNRFHNHATECHEHRTRNRAPPIPKDYENTTESDEHPITNEPNSTLRKVRKMTNPNRAQHIREVSAAESTQSTATNNSTNSPKSDTKCRFLPRLQGVENPAFQNQENSAGVRRPTESEVYFADVSSCCNVSVRNDGQDSSLYDEADENPVENEDYLAQRMGKQRQMSTRSRLPFPAAELPKDLSQNSLSSIQTPLTDTTDDTLPSPNQCCINYNLDDQFLAPDAQYEVIQQANSPRNFSPRKTGPNISSLIQNLGSVNLLYDPEPDDAVKDDDEDKHQVQGINSDATMDSGWQSGSERPENSVVDENTTSRFVNV